jgi:enamine deaminase RidA (YjgF/YER057c/UK114 family)
MGPGEVIMTESGQVVMRSEINPWQWSRDVPYSQAVLVEKPERILYCSGHTAIGPDGAPPAILDTVGQVEIAMANLAITLEQAGMAFANIVKLTVFTTAIDDLFPRWAPIADRLAPNVPAATLVGITRLVYPELKVEIEAIAVA